MLAAAQDRRARRRGARGISREEPERGEGRRLALQRPGDRAPALQREAAAQRDLLESFLARYREAVCPHRRRLPAGRRAHHLARRSAAHLPSRRRP